MEKSKNNDSSGTDGKKCPKCADTLIIRKGKFGEFWCCTNFSRCKYTDKIYEDIDEHDDWGNRDES